jgi:hypothetical protein
MALPLSGPAFWDQHFGIADFEEFRPLADKYLAGFGSFGIQLPNEVLAQIAYNAPYSALGTYLGGRIAASGYVGTDKEQSTSDVVTLTTPFVIGQLQQETDMSSLVIADCFQVTISSVAGGHAIENVIGVKKAGGTAAGAAAAVKTAWEIASGPLANLATLSSMVNYHAVDISSTTGTIADLASTTAGGRASQNLATRGACALIKWNGANRSRSTRGRLYYGPICESDIQADGATLDTTRATAIGTAFSNFRTSLTSSGYPLVVLSRTLSQAFDVTASAVEAGIATQRRRIR